MSAFARIWRLLAKRAAHDWLMLTAAVITVVMATTLLAAGPIYADAVTLSSLRRTLADAPINAANLSLTLSSRPGRFDLDDEIVVDELATSVHGIDYEVLRQIDSESYEIEGSDDGVTTELAVFRYMEGVEDHAALIAGEWPTESGDGVEMTVPSSVAETLGLSVGDVLELVNRQDRGYVVRARVSGIYTVDLDDSFWFDDPLATAGVIESSSFTTYGPMLTTEHTLTGAASPIRARFTWRVFPDFSDLTVPEIPSLRDSVSRLEERLNNVRDLGRPDSEVEGVEFQLETQLAELLTTTDKSLVVTRTGVLMLSVQLAVLAGYALILTAGLLVDIRRSETNLIRSRGGGNGQILVAGILEGLLLTVPAALAAPTLATLALEALTRYGPLASIGLTLHPVAGTQAYLLALVAAAGCTLALSLPTYRSARSFSDPRALAGRQRREAGTHRAGVDIALLVLAALAFWQLGEHGADITSAVRGRLGIDPLVVAAPALGLLAGGVLALRTIPWLALLAERVASRGTSTVPALSAWQVARRPLRYARAALLLIMAVSIGLFATSYTTTWSHSQDDQADFQVGSDIRVYPDRRTGVAMPDIVLAKAQSTLEGVNASLPVATSTGQLSRSDPTLGRFVMMDAATAGEVVTIRDDIGGSALDEMMDRLVAGRPLMGGVPIPGEPEGLTLSATLDLEPTPDEIETGLVVANVRPSARLILQDGTGLLHRVNLGVIEPDVGEVELEGTLTVTGPDGRVFAPAYPLRLVDIVLLSGAPQTTRRFSLTIHGIGTANPDGSSDALDLGGVSWMAANSESLGVFQPPAIRIDEPVETGAISATAVSGSSAGDSPAPVYFSLRPSGTVLPATFPVVVTEGFLDATTTQIGDTISLPALRLPIDTAEIVGSIDEFPTVEPGSAEVLLMDLPTMQMMAYEPGVDPIQPSEYWLDVTGPPDAVVAALHAEPFESFSITARQDRANSLKADPIALGTIASLSLGFIAAAVFAAVGFAVSATVSARERITEFALLRALGLSNRQLGSWLAIEQGALVVVSLVIGTVVGVLLCIVVLPLVAISQAGESVIPALRVIVPYGDIVLLESIVIGTLIVIVVVLALLLRRLGLGSLLRMGED